MTDKAITFKSVFPTTLAIALGIMILMGTVHLTGKYAVPIDQAQANHAAVGSREIAALPNPDLQLSRVRLLLSSMK
jgi:hypothetical protein